MTPPPIQLSAGELEATVEPALGGRITAFRRSGVDLFVPVAGDRGEPARVGAGGCFPLVPWSNRIRDGRLGIGGRTLELAATETGAGHAIHGHGRRRAWTVSADGSPLSVRMRYAHPAGEEGWPFAYTADQTVSLGDDALSITLSVENTSSDAMPVGLGLHPYLARTPEMGLWFEAASAWPPIDGKLPAGPQPVPAELDFSEPRAVVSGLDQGFGGWNGSVHAIWPERGLALAIHGGAALNHLIVFTPPDRDYLCLEPVTHCIDAANLAARGVGGTGHRMLQAKERLAVTVRFQIEVF
ncbi:aldose 1-epimerase [Thalassobaculum sp.]|uniref:aldose 1-epimerase n=1 Tax=Thalassobaculum sp. TaxID=2022740 RepID=UPI0032EADA13